MPGLANDLVVHNLHVVPGAKTVKQSPRQFRHEIDDKIKQDIKKLLKAGFIKPIQHLTWLANIVQVDENER